jgi:Flp pilus assembly protein TadG
VTDERGTVTAFVAVFTVALLAVAGLVVDGGFVLAARRQAFDEAEAAARAGAQAVDIDSLRAGGPVRFDPDAARAKALDYLAATGHRGLVDVVGDTVRVHVAFERDMTMLGLLGLGPVTIDGDGEARGVRGVIVGGD